jgi:hypothetical protein
MFAVCLGLLWLLYKFVFEFDTNYPCICLIFCIWIRLMVAVVARSAIAHGVELCLEEMRSRNIAVLAGFSWGAGVLSELLTRETGLDVQPAFLLIAPVSSATAVAAMRDDAAFRLHPTSTEMVHVVHATDDPVFCPHPDRWDALTNVKSYTLQDVHVFKQPSSRRALAEIMTTLFRAKTENVEP